MTTDQNFPYLVKTSKFTFAEKKTTDQKQEKDDIAGGRTMFYSHCLLSSKGPLGAIWVAGYFFKRLKKRQITDTDISSSVDKILLEGLPSVTYRILAYLLLGVVRIYSKKVEYLFHDCHETVSDINRFSVGKEVTPFRDIVRLSHSITLPEKYELDSFPLEVPDVSSRGNIARNKDISLRANAEKDVFPQYSLDKQRFEEVSTVWEDMYDAQPSLGFTEQLATCSSIQTPVKAAVEQETSTFAHTPPSIVLSPRPMEIDVEVSSPDQKNFETSKEKLRQLRYAQEEGMDVDRICELDVELLNMINDYKEQTPNNWDEDSLKKEPLDDEYDLLKVKEMPTSTDKAHDLEASDVRAAATPDFMVVPTPAKKEKVRRPGKRKCMFDEITMLDNAIMKLAIEDASDLICKRRKAPHTVTDLWRFHRIPSLSKIFVEPLIPCVAVELQYIHSEKKRERTEPSTSQAVEHIQTTPAPQKQQDAVAPIAPADSSRSIIAPGTPVQCPTSARVFGRTRAVDSDGEGVQCVYAHDNMKELSVHEEENFEPNLMAEMDATEGDSQEVHKNKNGNCLVEAGNMNGNCSHGFRTSFYMLKLSLTLFFRTVARYLHRVMQRKRKQGVEAITLLPIVERKTKRENAMLFFELLVLSSGGFINVTQEKAYGDMLLQETPQLEAAAALKKC
ncbi:Sister chromatid cohesion 1 protein 2 [Bienertia sinuspersici]